MATGKARGAPLSGAICLILFAAWAASAVQRSVRSCLRRRRSAAALPSASKPASVIWPHWVSVGMAEGTDAAISARMAMLLSPPGDPAAPALAPAPAAMPCQPPGSVPPGGVVPSGPAVPLAPYRPASPLTPALAEPPSPARGRRRAAWTSWC